MRSERERRHQSRLLVSRAEHLRAELDARTVRASADVADLSLGGAGLLLAGRPAWHGGDVVDLALEGSGRLLGRSPVDVVYEQPSGDGALLGVRFRQPDEPFLQAICRFLVDRQCQLAEQPRFAVEPDRFELVADAARVRSLFALCQRQRVAVRVHRADGAPAGAFDVGAIEGATVRGRVRGWAGTLAPGEPCHLVVATFTAAYVVLATLGGIRHGETCFETAGELRVGTTRDHFRIRLADDFPVALEFVHPHLPGKLVRKVATDVGPGGLSFPLDVEQDLLAPGTCIDSAVLRLPDGRSLGCRCIVRHVVRELAGYRCGVECTDFAADSRWHWVRALLQRALPRVQAVGRSGLDEVWDVFDRSGYLDEKPAELLDAMREPFRKAWADLAQARGDSQCWVLRDGGEAVATVSMSRIYSRTWLFHHLGADLFHFERKQQNLDAIAEIALRTAPQWIAGLAPDGYGLTFFDADKHFNRWSWFHFFEQHEGRGELCSQRLAVRDVPVDGAGPSRRHRHGWARPATARELRWIADDLQRRDGPLLYEALDFAPDRIALSGLDGSAHLRALGRRREVLVGGAGQQVAGYAIVESATPGVNIFSLYDTCRIVLTSSSSSSTARAVRDALLARAVRHFRSRGSPSFLYLTGPGDAPPPPDEGAFEARAVRTVMTLRLLVRWAESVDRIWTQGWPSRS